MSSTNLITGSTTCVRALKCQWAALVSVCALALACGSPQQAMQAEAEPPAPQWKVTVYLPGVNPATRQHKCAYEPVLHEFLHNPVPGRAVVPFPAVEWIDHESGRRMWTTCPVFVEELER